MEILPKEILLPLQVFGCLPLKYVYDSEKKELIFSYKWFFWGLSVTLVYATFTFYGLYSDYAGRLVGEPIRMFTDTKGFTVVLDVATLGVLGVIIFLSSAVRHQTFIETFTRLQKIDEDLKLKNVPTKSVRSKVIVVFIGKTIVIILAVGFYLHQYKGFIVYVPHWITYYVQATVVVFSVNIFLAIKQRFDIVNEKLKNEVIKHSFGQLLRGVEDCHPKTDFIPGTEVPIFKLRALTEKYWLLCEVVCKANQFLNWHLLVSVISLSIHTVIAFFNLFSQIWPIIEPEIVDQMIIRTTWIMVHSSELLMILWSSTALTNSANKTAPMICKLMSRHMDVSLKRHLEIFLLSLRHQNAKFSALGLFQIHSQILTPIAGAMTTYLVILIQFQAQTPTDFDDDTF